MMTSDWENIAVKVRSLTYCVVVQRSMFDGERQ